MKTLTLPSALAAAGLAFSAVFPAFAQQPPAMAEAGPPAPPYADMADLVIASPLVIDVQVLPKSSVRKA